jgi:hypothetical protein
MKDIQLFNNCRWNESRSVSKILDNKSDIDLTYNNGIYFRFAIKHNNVEMLNTLLQYFEKTKLQGDFENQYAIPCAKQQLQQILQDAVKSFDISEKIQKVLDNYIPKEEDSDQEQEIEDITIPFFNKSTKDIELTKDNLKKLTEEFDRNDQIKSYENLMSFNFPKIEIDQSGNYDESRNQNIELLAKNSHLVDSD